MANAKTPIGSDHVLLISQLFRREEGTWGVVFGDFYYHNFSAYDLSTLSFLNKPILSAYLVAHPKWRIKYAAKKPSPKVPAKGRGVTLARLRRHCEFTQVRKWA